LKIQVLGTGTSQGIPVIACDCPVCTSNDPKDTRLRCSIYIEVDNLKLVVDIGPDFRMQMLNADIKDIDAILMTHEHNDHSAGLDDVRPFNFKYKKDIPLYSSLAVQEDLRQRFQYVFKTSDYPGAPRINLKAIENVPFKIEKTQIHPILVQHGSMPVFGFRINQFTYITDAKEIKEEELAKVKGSQVLILNALQKKEHFSHLNLSEALQIIEKINPEKAYLTHVSHLMGKSQDISKELPPHVELCYDGLAFEL